MHYIIEICAEDTDSPTKRGRILELFSKEFLETQGFEVQKEVRLTGMEIDLLCKDKSTGETVLVECKAYRNNLSADAISKMLGNVLIRGANAGWLITTHDLTKDGRGIKHDWSNKPSEERRKMRIYEPQELVERLIYARLVVDPISLGATSEEFRTTDQAYLLVTERGRFWAMPMADLATGVTSTCKLFHASSGTYAGDLSDWIRTTDTTLAELDWSNSKPTAERSKLIEDELQSIVTVPMADAWSDLRPARPMDFVGREECINSVFDFFDNIRDAKTTTRVLALKAPSGWGKSSTVHKIVDKSRKAKNKKNIYVFAVDSRAAATRRFPELALTAAIKSAINDGFMDAVDDLVFGGAGNFFSSDTIKTLLQTLADEGKVICLIFDQFEELLYKPELSEVFEDMKKLCTSVEGAQTNIAVGFSWRTDGSITTEHKAYHLWHELEDHRVEIDLPPFSDAEVSKAIGRFGKELGQVVSPQLRRVLIDNCQGYPWLLKKLCVHIFELVRSGSDQSDIIGQGLNIEELFRKDLQRLSSGEFACIKQIAKESPAEYFKIDQIHGAEIVNTLIQKRLIIRSGTRLSVYWDIFRDYVLSEQIPYIPNTYIPQSNFSRYVPALNFLRDKRTASYEELATAMQFSHASVDNLVRDLVNLGHASANRKEGTLSALFNNDADAYRIAFDFWLTHEVVRRIRRETDGDIFSRERMAQIFSEITSRSQFAAQTQSVYLRRTLRWLLSTGLILEFADDYRLMLDAKATSRDALEVKYDRNRRSGMFIGEAPFGSVVAALESVPALGCTRTELQERTSRNAVSALFSLGLLRESDSIIILTGDWAKSEQAVFDAALQTRTIPAAIRAIEDNPDIKGRELGILLSEQFSLNWSEGSQKRNGGSIRKWARAVADGGFS